MSRIEFDPWFGEFGWEVATWAPHCRKLADNYDEVVVTSFADMQPLYADFATEFRDNGQQKRSLNYPKQYHIDGKYYRYGDAIRADVEIDILIHARGIRRKASINYRRWNEFIKLIEDMPYSFGVVGGPEDMDLGNLIDLRNLPLQKLMDQISAARLVVGVSSGLMHLSAFCGTDLVVWGDRRTYFGETLQRRYEKTWNPFGVKIGWINANDFQPDPEQIVKTIKELL